MSTVRLISVERADLMEVEKLWLKYDCYIKKAGCSPEQERSFFFMATMAKYEELYNK